MKYTKQQITEAIEFWTKVLENTSPFLDELIVHYDYNLVFRSKKLSVRLDDIKRIQQVAIDTIFGEKLKRIAIIEDEESKYTSDSVPVVYGYSTYTDPETQKTVLLTVPAVDSEGNHYSLPAIYVNLAFLRESMPLIELASIIVHEMVHQSIVENADSSKLDQIARSVDVNSGRNEEFIAMMNDINSKHGLNITIQGSSSYEQDSVDALKKFAGNDYDVNENDSSRKELMKVKRSKDGAFTRVTLC